jgi:hypothetical protein
MCGYCGADLSQHEFHPWYKDRLFCSQKCIGELKDLESSGSANAPATKPSNPKDAFAVKKLPLSLWPVTASAQGALALLAGASKYGRNNFRVDGVRISTYYDALLRHMAAYWEGQDNDPEDSVSHLGHALACIAILVEAGAVGKLTDDRPTVSGWGDTLAGLTPLVAKIREQYAAMSPKHHTKEGNGP